MMYKDIIGMRFGRLIVTEQVSDYVSPSGGAHKRFSCVCDCGRTVYILKEHLTSGRQKSCGCLRKENGIVKHGEIDTRLYRIWGNMINRCSNKSSPAWDRYGGRGIHVCDEWKDFRKFRSWAYEHGYDDTLTIDRIDNDKGYCPANCRWATCTEQANNKRNNHVIEYNGEIKTVSEWANTLGIPYKTLYQRIVGRGWSIERAFGQRPRKSPNKKDG